MESRRHGNRGRLEQWRWREIIEYNANPWFLEGQGPVKYCIRRSEQYFPVPEEALDTMVRSAVESWDVRFSIAHVPGNQPGYFRVQTKGFLRVPCSDNVDLAFQFGELTSEQVENFQKLGINPKKYVAMSIHDREYDRKNLRWGGFIYVSPSTGPMKFEAEDVVENPWTRDEAVRLQAVITHELGHIFGLRHQGGRTELMGESFPEYIISGRMANKRIDLSAVAEGCL